MHNWTQWSTIQGVIGRVTFNQPSAYREDDLKLRARLPLNCTVRSPVNPIYNKMRDKKIYVPFRDIFLIISLQAVEKQL